jgi:hypothetical protein
VTKANDIPEKAKPYIDEILEELEELASLRGSYMASCKVIRDRIKEVKTRAVDDGIRRKALNKWLERHQLEADLEALDEELEDEDKEQYELLVESLARFGELPLVDAALKRAKGEKPEAVDPADQAPKKGRKSKAEAPKLSVVPPKEDGEDPRPQFLKDREAERVAESTKRIEEGIKPLDTPPAGQRLQ